MANYPTVTQLIGSVKDTLTGTEVDRAESGKPRFRTFYSQEWDVFNVLHECYIEDRDAIEDHYREHRFSEFGFVFAGDGVEYLCRYADKPKFVPIEGDQRWRVQAVLIGTRRLSYGVVVVGVSSSISVTGVAS